MMLPKSINGSPQVQYWKNMTIRSGKKMPAKLKMPGTVGSIILS